MASRRLKRHRKNNAKFDSDKDEQNPTDEVLAAESLANYMRSNNSFVMDVFQAQFRSSLTCPACDKQSNTFDPFLCVSLPIPQKQMIPVFVTVLYIDQTPRQVKLGVSIGVHETIGDLRTMLSNDTGIERGQILLAEIDDLTFRRTFKDSDPVSVINEKPSPSCDLFCIEVLKHKETTEDDGAYILVTWVNVLKEGPIEKRFGSPYTIQVSREVLYEDLQKLLMKEMASILHDDILIANQKVPLFNIRVLDGLSNVSVDKDKDIGNYLDASVELPMYTLAIEQAIALCSVTDNVPHVKFTLEWDAPAKSQIIADDRNQIEEHFSVKQVAKCPSEATAVSLKECFGLYTKAEKLGDGDAWFCPECKRKQEVVKKMGLWSLPDVLIIHLKRFRQTSNTSSNKLSTMVECPLEGYDMSPFVTNAGTTKASNSALPSELQQQRPQVESSHTSNMWTNVFSSFKRDNSHKNSSNQDVIVEPMSGVQTIDQDSASSQQQPQKEANETASETTTASANSAYDLYAVCNHHGDDLQGGHYTATCRNPTDGHWYSFDDIHTSKVDEPDVVSADAYILFYQKQSLAPNSSSTSSASSSSSSNQEHWVYRMPDFSYKNKTTQMTKAQTQSTPNSGSATSTATSGSSSTTSGSTAGKNGSTFSRNSPKYATMPAAAKSESKDTSASKKEPSISGSGDTSATVTNSGSSEDAENKTIIDQSETKSLQCEEMQQQQEMSPRADSSSSNNHEDVSRPIDKNDVD
jgi:ubiquitin carboxyl-terminal hydrolase 31